MPVSQAAQPTAPNLSTESDPARALPLSRFRLVYERGSGGAPYTGSAWRGTLGYALKKLVCIARGQECPSCFLYRSCVYPYIFETPPPEDTARMRLYPAAPHPFVLAPADCAGLGRAALELTLFGRSGQYLAYMLHALRSAGECQKRGPAELARVEQEIVVGGGQWRVIHLPGAAIEPLAPSCVRVPDPPPLAGIAFQTPLRIRRDEQYAGVERITLADLLRNLVRRISALAYFHADTELDADFRALRDLAGSRNWIDSRLRWQDQNRYSSRQHRRVPIGGVLGVALVKPQDLGPLWPFLWIGQFTGAGKGTALGLGRYRVESVREGA